MATGYLYEGSINRLSRIVINGSTVFYIILDNYEKPIRLLQENIKASDLANLVFAQIGDQVRIRCDWSNKDEGYFEGISFEYEKYPREQ